MLTFDRGSLGRNGEALVRRFLQTVPAPVLIAAALGGAWSLDVWAHGRMAVETPAPCGLHVVVPQRSGRIVWIVKAAEGAVRSGDVVARLESPSGGFDLEAPVGGVVHSVLRKAGETVQPGDPLLVLGPAAGVACP